MTGVFVRRLEVISPEDQVITVAESGEHKIVVITRKRGRKPSNKQPVVTTDVVGHDDSGNVDNNTLVHNIHADNV